jgi:phosphatidylglycerol:prolipoprotein diacylglycerol transferase
MLLQLPYHNVDPVFLNLGPVQLRWYGLMYMMGFIICYFIMKRLVEERKLSFSTDDLYDLLFYLIVGVMVGGRLGYVLFYDLGSYLEDPAAVFAIWRGGMSFHGGLVGTTLAAILIVRKKGWQFWEVADIVAVAAPIGIGLGRIGNFINGELYGRPSDLPWAMVFPDGGSVGRHPSQLYEALLEGLVLFLALLWIYRKNLQPGMTIWGLVAGYGLFRFSVEFFRAPDAHIGYDLGPFTRGQLLSFPMLLVGTFFLVSLALKHQRAASATPQGRREKRRPK